MRKQTFLTIFMITTIFTSCLQTNSNSSAQKSSPASLTKVESASINLNSRVDVDFSSLLREYPNLTRLHIANSSGHSSAVISKKTLSSNPILKLKPVGSNGHYTVTVFLPNSSVTKIIR